MLKLLSRLFKRNNLPSKLFTVVRSDMSPGYQLAQTLHAGIEFMYKKAKLKVVKEWKENSNTVICLSVFTEKSLVEAYIEATRLGYDPVCFTEPDIGDEFTSFAFIGESDAGYKLERSVTAKLPLALSSYR